MKPDTRPGPQAKYSKHIKMAVDWKAMWEAEHELALRYKTECEYHACQNTGLRNEKSLQDAELLDQLNSAAALAKEQREKIRSWKAHFDLVSADSLKQREQIKSLSEALQSIVRRWDDSEKTGSLAWSMCEDARAVLPQEVIVDPKIFDQAHGLRETQS